MRRLIIAVLICGTSFLAPAQKSPSSQWQRGTITVVTAHPRAPGERASDAVQYEVSVTVGTTIYVVLYAPPNGANAVEYRQGIDLSVLVGPHTLTFNNGPSGTTEVPILHEEVLPAASGPDLSKVPGEYFSLKLQQLSQALNLSEDQQRQIKPILEQETAEVGQFWANPVLSREDKLKRWEKVVRPSDKRLEAFLSSDQVHKLQRLRKEQKQKLKQLNAEQKEN